jgi:hypothetical protein
MRYVSANEKAVSLNLHRYKAVLERPGVARAQHRGGGLPALDG